MVNGVAVVDKEKCVACMKCINICPKKIISLRPYKSKTVVECKSLDSGKVVRNNCSIGCIGCGICEKNCPKDAIHVEIILHQLIMTSVSTVEFVFQNVQQEQSIVNILKEWKK
ncbi:ferredoxin [Peptoniphilus harei]|uniref:Ferredoxin n=1 Tax=Peptoniphilus harei TaxID=54005 RepID=A0A2X1ZJW0_9FIRM|nr:ferredoxin [Peptoniphilus harei]